MPYDGLVFIADKSAWVRAHLPEVATEWEEALRARQIATCHLTNLELLYSARNAEEFEELEEELLQLRLVPVTPSVLELAQRALRDLSRQGPARANFHRVKTPDAIIAAAAADAGIGVLHYDRDYDRLATVLDFESRWIAPAGAIS